MGIHETRQGTRNCKRIQRHCGIPHRYQHLTTSNLARRHLPHDSALRVRDRPRNREQHRFPTPKPKQEPRQEQAGQNHAYLEPLVTIRPPTHGIRRGAAPRVPLPQIQAWAETARSRPPADPACAPWSFPPAAGDSFLATGIPSVLAPRPSTAD